MSNLGMIFSRKAQVLGKKIESKSRLLGTKANQALRIGDTVLRKAENTIKNKVIPATCDLIDLTAPSAPSAIGADSGANTIVAGITLFLIVFSAFLNTVSPILRA